MKIDYEYAYQLLKILEKNYPRGIEYDDVATESDEERIKRVAHIFYLEEECLVTEIATPEGFLPNYRLTSKAINLLNGFEPLEEWIRKKRHAK